MIQTAFYLIFGIVAFIIIAIAVVAAVILIGGAILLVIGSLGILLDQVAQWITRKFGV